MTTKDRIIERLEAYADAVVEMHRDVIRHTITIVREEFAKDECECGHTVIDHGCGPGDIGQGECFYPVKGEFCECDGFQPIETPEPYEGE